jgi:hypothetical protein
MEKEYIYILSNTKQDGIVKVGKSKNNPIIRAEQLTTNSKESLRMARKSDEVLGFCL